MFFGININILNIIGKFLFFYLFLPIFSHFTPLFSLFSLPFLHIFFEFFLPPGGGGICPLAPPRWYATGHPSNLNVNFLLCFIFYTCKLNTMLIINILYIRDIFINIWTTCRIAGGHTIFNLALNIHIMTYSNSLQQLHD